MTSRATRQDVVPTTAPGSPAVRPFAARLTRRRARDIALPVADALVVAAAVYVTFVLRFDEVTPFRRIEGWLPIAILPIFIRPLLNRVFGLYAHSWRYISVPELLRLVVAVAAGTLAVLAAYAILAVAGLPAATGFPRSFWILEAVLSATAMAAIRLGPRILVELRAGSPRRQRSERGTPSILYGAGEAGAMMARAAIRQPSAGLRPVAFLDDNQRKWGRSHAGIPVMGDLASLGEVIQRTGAEAILMTMPAATGERLRTIADAAISLDLQVRTVPSLDEMLGGSVGPQMMRPLKLEDLLRRPPVPAETLERLSADLREEVVLVTGAGGSIGSELARQLAALGPRRLVLLDRAEGPLYELQRELESRTRGSDGSPPDVHFRVADIVDRAAISRLFAKVQPTLVFHAAAYKHVPVMEDQPVIAVEVNVGGTLALVDAASDHGVERFVLVSTDKAVEPANVMGATKRVAELVVAEAGRTLGKRWVSVRFGNVLGSSGSVVPIFQKQLEAGESLTVTHEEMTRYFMTIPEAVHLILQAATLAEPADLFVLDMGEPVRIVDLARDLIRLSGRGLSRGAIRFTGLRPGEKLHERLFYEEEAVAPTRYPKIFRVPSPLVPEASAHRMAQRLVRSARSGNEDAVRHQLMAAVAAATDLPRRQRPPAAEQSRRAPPAPVQSGLPPVSSARSH